MADLVDFGIAFRTQGAQQAEAAIERVGQKGQRAARQVQGLERGTGALAGAFRRNSFAVTNAANQFSDLAVQIGAGVPVTRALSQQLPQLTAVMGPVASILGVASGVAIGLAGSFLAARDDAQTLEDQLDGLEDALGGVEQSLKDTALTADDLRDRFGAMAQEMRSVLATIAQARVAELELELQSLAATLDATTSEFFLFGQGGRDLQAGLDELSATLGVSRLELVGIRDAYAEIVNARGPDELVAATQEFLGSLEAVGLEFDGLPPAIQASLGPLFELVALIAQGEARASALRANLAGMSTITTTSFPALTGDVAADLPPPPGAASAPGGFAPFQRPAGLTLGGPPVGRVSGGGGGGGGMSEAEQEARRLEALAKRVFESTRTEIEKEARARQDYEELLRRGLISQDTFNRAIADLGAGLENAAGLAQDIASTVSGELSGAFSDVIRGTATVGEALEEFAQNVLLRIADQLFEKLIASPLEQAIGTALGGLSFSADGNAFDRGLVPFAKGGVVGSPTLFTFANGGRLGLMGEAGPEAILPLSRGADGKLGVKSSGGGVNVQVNVANYTSEQVDVQDDGSGKIEVTIGRVLAQDIRNGGPTYQAIKRTFGLRQPSIGRG